MTDVDEESRSRVALGVFKERMYQLDRERVGIDEALGAVDIMHLAQRTRHLLRSTKALMDGNVTVLFAHQPPHVPEELYKYLEYADNHVISALSQEYDFEAVKRRLYMATMLAAYVIEGVQGAVSDIETRMA